jgi:hypothetical protein
MITWTPHPTHPFTGERASICNGLLPMSIRKSEGEWVAHLRGTFIGKSGSRQGAKDMCVESARRLAEAILKELQ